MLGWGVEARVTAEISPHLPPGFSVEAVGCDGGDGVRLRLGDADLGTVGGVWECILDGVEDPVSRETTEPFHIPRRGGRLAESYSPASQPPQVAPRLADHPRRDGDRPPR